MVFDGRPKEENGWWQNGRDMSAALQSTWGEMGSRTRISSPTLVAWEVDAVGAALTVKRRTVLRVLSISRASPQCSPSLSTPPTLAKIIKFHPIARLTIRYASCGNL